MNKNYFRIAVRYFRKNKVTTLINVLGLSIGICAALVIFMVIKYDYSFDQFEPGRERIYRVVTAGDDWGNPGVPTPFPEALKQNATGVEAVASIFDYNDNNTKVTIPLGPLQEDKLFKKQQQVAFVDAAYFNLVPHRWLAGTEAIAFRNPNSLVLTESRAATYFPGISPDRLIGRTVVFSDTLQTAITGVVADLKDNSDFEKKSFISLKTIYQTSLKKAYQTDNWSSTNSANQVLIRLAPHVNAATVSREIQKIFNEHKAITGSKERPKDIHRLQSLSVVHTDPDLEGPVDPTVVRNLGVLSLFLLALAAINFINLSTAHASERAKEIGIRKTLGSGRGQLIAQFLSETFLVTLVAALLSTVIMPLLLKVFGSFIPAGLDANYLLNEPLLWLFLLGLTVVVSLAAGLYPALIVAKFKPVSAIKDTNTGNGGGTRSAYLRKTLIVSQFVIAQVFVIGVLVVNKQLHYAQTKDMGFRKEAIINFYVPFDFSSPNNKKFVLKQELSTIPEIEAVSLGNQSPAFNGSMSTEVFFKENGKDMRLDVNSRSGDTAFLKVYHLQLIAGRNIRISDTANELLINETLARQIGFNHSADAVGHMLSFGNGIVPVVGVMRDFNQASVRTAVAPMIYFSAPKFGYVMHVALQQDPTTWNEAIRKITAAWKGVYPAMDFDYTFLDKQIEQFYKEDRQLSLLLSWAAGVAILLSSLGMLGLVIFTTNKRVKEIGVRKVLGATVTQIVTLLAGDFARLLLIAFVIAIPIAWWQTHQWLQNYAYHTELSWWLLLAGGAIMITVALLIVTIRAGKAASANPVKSLRTE